MKWVLYKLSGSLQEVRIHTHSWEEHIHHIRFWKGISIPIAWRSIAFIYMYIVPFSWEEHIKYLSYGVLSWAYPYPNSWEEHIHHMRFWQGHIDTHSLEEHIKISFIWRSGWRSIAFIYMYIVPFSWSEPFLRHILYKMYVRLSKLRPYFK